MQKTLSKQEEIKLIGLKVRTNNTTEANWMHGKIFPLVQQYFSQQLANKIPNRKQPGTTLCVYTEYESDHTGNYTYYIGEIVTSLNNIPEGLHPLTIPPPNLRQIHHRPSPHAQRPRQRLAIHLANVP